MHPSKVRFNWVNQKLSIQAQPLEMNEIVNDGFRT